MRFKDGLFPLSVVLLVVNEYLTSQAQLMTWPSVRSELTPWSSCGRPPSTPVPVLSADTSWTWPRRVLQTLLLWTRKLSATATCRYRPGLDFCFQLLFTSKNVISVVLLWCLTPVTSRWRVWRRDKATCSGSVPSTTMVLENLLWSLSPSVPEFSQVKLKGIL